MLLNILSLFYWKV
jgi:soluble epoxide hydrolase/lipid-phosphate phosphatase